MAPALVLPRDAADVWQGSNAGQAADARTGNCLGNHRNGSRPQSKTARVAAADSVGQSEDRRTSGVPILS